MVDVRKLRDEWGLTQSQFAWCLGCHVIQVSKWEREIAKPTGIYALLLDAYSQISFTASDQFAFRQKVVRWNTLQLVTYLLSHSLYGFVLVKHDQQE